MLPGEQLIYGRLFVSRHLLPPARETFDRHRPLAFMLRTDFDLWGGMVWVIAKV